MTTGDYAASVRALRDLRAAERARLTANTPRPKPSWWTPTAAITHGAGIALVVGPWAYGTGGAAWRIAVAVTGIAALAVFPALCVWWVSRSRVRAWPPRGRGRLALECAPLLAWAVGWAVYEAYGRAPGAVTAGVLSGFALWWRESARRGLDSAAAAESTAAESAVAESTAAERAE
ncbi:hypothetical protein ACFU99_38470 [Streptomyces sp. NPDC057654]|uniref:hypothetical protein n=1 Tax=Streptomyces sp. NPDC057654 TaxID=3346196 RepID=UPI0036D0886A